MLSEIGESDCEHSKRSWNCRIRWVHPALRETVRMENFFYKQEIRGTLSETGASTIAAGEHSKGREPSIFWSVADLLPVS